MDEQAQKTLRMLALLHLAAYLPCDYTYPKPTGAIGGDRFRRITNDVWVWPGTKAGTTTSSWQPGTTCGFLTHWLLWALGCRDGKTINRTDSGWNDAKGAGVSATGGALRYLNTLNLTRTRKDISAVKNAKGSWEASPTTEKAPKKGAFLDWVSDKGWALGRPSMGDIVFISTSAGQREHVFVFLQEIVENGKTYWLTADGGQASVAGAPYLVTCAAANMKDKPPSSFMCFNKRRVTFSTSQGVQRAWIGSRKVDGWIDLSQLPANAWTWDTTSAAGPVLDPAVIDVLPRAWSYAGTTDGQQQQAAWQLAAALAVQTFWDWYCENWASSYTFSEWAGSVVYALGNALNGTTSVGVSLPTGGPEIEAQRELAQALARGILESQRAASTLELENDDAELAISETLADTISLHLGVGR